LKSTLEEEIRLEEQQKVEAPKPAGQTASTAATATSTQAAEHSAPQGA